MLATLLNYCNISIFTFEPCKHWANGQGLVIIRGYTNYTKLCERNVSVGFELLVRISTLKYLIALLCVAFYICKLNFILKVVHDNLNLFVNLPLYTNLVQLNIQ